MASANQKLITVGPAGGTTNLKMAVGTVVTSTGTANIEASEFGLNSIVHVFGTARGGTPLTGYTVAVSTAFSATGTAAGTNVVVECQTDAGANADLTLDLLVFGT